MKNKSKCSIMKPHFLIANMLSQCERRLKVAKKQAYWTPLVKTLKFIVHFLVVMMILYCGALVFARLEDPDVMYGDQKSTPSGNTSSEKRNLKSLEIQSLMGCANKSNFWREVEDKYNFTVPPEIQDNVLQFINHNIQQLKHKPRNQEKFAALHSPHHRAPKVTQDKDFVFMKWFYFTIIATTTIGYGQVYPRTNSGKLFYIFFSIIGIVLMMTLLRSCGKILMTANKKLYTWICKRVVARYTGYVSDELVSIISMSLMFLVFMCFVVWHDKNIGEVRNWSWVDTAYFWLVTFTTVGFGDVHFPLEVEIDHFYELVVYRVFGLAFLSGIIESIHVYIRYRRQIIVQKQKKRLRRLSEMIIGTATPLGLTANFLPGVE